ncbi:MAG: NAD(P)-dependent oxidoreductase [candidate division Zixibacteria bacterium]|nr:NAD(P)-dependent oxidoreductase [candidate division Zixibacteria bacterium]
MNFKKKNIFVTGGAGYIGSVLVNLLLSKGYKITVLDNLLHGYNPLVNINSDNLIFVEGDIRDKATVENVINNQDVVVHLAAIVGEPACNKNQELTHSTNKIGSEILLQATLEKKIEKFIFVSTCSNYGIMSDNADCVDENSPLKPISIYSETKVEFENLLLNNKIENFYPVVLRFATVYGTSPRMRFDLTVNEFTKELYLGRELEIFGEQFWRPYCHTKDIARACQIAIESDSSVAYQAFNVGATDENFQKKEIVNKIIKQMPEKENLIKFVEKNRDPRNYKVSFEKIKKILNFVPDYNVDYGIEEIIKTLDSDLFDNPDASKYRNI